jgi:hypothetical protein
VILSTRSIERGSCQTRRVGLDGAHLDHTVVVAVAVVRMVEVIADEVVDVIAVRHRLVTAIDVVLVLPAPIRVGAAVWMRDVDLDYVLVDVVAVRMVEVAVVQVVDVVPVDDGGVAAAVAVLMRMIAVDVVIAHGWRFSSRLDVRARPSTHGRRRSRTR